MIEPIEVAGSRAWLKHYRNGRRRRLRLAALDLVARRLELDPLRPPPRHGGTEALRTEQRRLGQLSRAGVRVPEILGVGRTTLLLSDLGPTLGSQMGAANGEPTRLDGLASAAIEAIADGHARGGYFGQPWPRNLTVGDAGVGFLDFEEDPLEVMPLPHAQARDWAVFTYGVARHYGDRPQVLERMLADALSRAPAGVPGAVAGMGRGLRPVERVAAPWRSRSMQALVRAASVLRKASVLLLVVALLLGVDLLHDGELDLFDLLS
ncbi:serine/threonine protein phosphatase [Lysobacter sp. GX 14042]|uniref:serine/threonine protein phosphatase n=1 Tax=Lysobacter sp. GX 14042 TaxID=2907155 RepID=UPI001F25B375|nr:serine/threonine protein phosphatase [Lysobacter sp. GX 14042]MCE7032451.1 serine/threonine protein phosphatase [Lysobacter sp. GX 14042]